MVVSNYSVFMIIQFYWQEPCIKWTDWSNNKYLCQPKGASDFVSTNLCVICFQVSLSFFNCSFEGYNTCIWVSSCNRFVYNMPITFFPGFFFSETYLIIIWLDQFLMFFLNYHHLLWCKFFLLFGNSSYHFFLFFHFLEFSRHNPSCLFSLEI